MPGIIVSALVLAIVWSTRGQAWVMKNGPFVSFLLIAVILIVNVALTGTIMGGAGSGETDR